MSVVRIEHVYKDYLLGDQKVQALKDITLSFEPGVFLAIAGPSGSGKTTLLNLIGCIDTPTSGKIYINDEDVGEGLFVVGGEKDAGQRGFERQAGELTTEV